MILVGVPFSADESSRNASIPGTRGMARSSRRMSGVSSRVWVTASAPSAASPTTSSSGSASSRRRRPSRKIVWSSAMTMRTDGSLLLSIRLESFLWNGDLNPGAPSRGRFNHHIASYRTHSLSDDRRPPAKMVEFLQGETAGERKTPAGIIDHQFPRTILCTKAYDSRLRAAVFPDIDQAFLHHPGQLDRKSTR